MRTTKKKTWRSTYVDIAKCLTQRDEREENARKADYKTKGKQNNQYNQQQKTTAAKKSIYISRTIKAEETRKHNRKRIQRRRHRGRAAETRHSSIPTRKRKRRKDEKEDIHGKNISGSYQEPGEIELLLGEWRAKYTLEDAQETQEPKNQDRSRKPKKNSRQAGKKA